MTAKEKAQELYYKYSDVLDYASHYEVKECAIIAAIELSVESDLETFNYWQDVKQEIENL